MISGNARISGCKAIDVQLHRPTDISVIRFRNNYTYAVSVLYQSAAATGPSLEADAHSGTSINRGTAGDWKVGVSDHTLMPSCHCDSPSAQKWVELGKETFQSRLEDVTKLRFILRQPSPHWREFGIEDISCYCRVDSPPAPDSLHHSHDHQGEWSSRNKVEKLLEVGRTAHSLLKSEREGNKSSYGSSHDHRSLSYDINLLSTS